MSDGAIPDMGARVRNANHLGELLTAPEARPAPEQADYQHLIDMLRSWHAEEFERTVEHQSAGEAAQPPDLTDWQEEYLEARQEVLAMKTAAAPAPAGAL
jgi:hypothetical protein